MSPEEITNKLQLTKLKDKLWYVAPSVATDGTGIFEGLVSTGTIEENILLTVSGVALQQCQDATAAKIIPSVVT